MRERHGLQSKQLLLLLVVPLCVVVWLIANVLRTTHWEALQTLSAPAADPTNGAWSSKQTGPRGLGEVPPGANGSGIPGYSILWQVPGDDLYMAGGWYALDMDYTFPQPDPQKYLIDLKGIPCSEVALHHVNQPITELYKRRHAPPTALPGGVPRTMIRWEGNITREQFDAVPDVLHGDSCPFCTKTTRYQIIDGHLYRRGSWHTWTAERKVNLDFLQDLLLVAIHLWDLPDMDFILHNGDGCPPEGVPVLSWTICRNRRQGGFGFPSYPLWRTAMGPAQNEAYHQCLVTRYNHTSRRPVVFWRGSTTDPVQGGELKIGIVHKVARMRLHKYFADDPAFDTKIDRIILADQCTKAYLEPLGDHVFIEDYARAAIILDIDGHGISGRFGQRYVDYGTPVVKQASNNTAYFEHLVAPGYMAEYFQNDLSDLKALGHRLIDEWKTEPNRLLHMAEQLQGFSAAFMHQMAIVEAAAYSLLEYSKRLTWKTVRDPTFSHVPFASVCGHEMNRLPRELCAQIQARPVRS